jgi:hypothetical protein
MDGNMRPGEDGISSSEHPRYEIDFEGSIAGPDLAFLLKKYGPEAKISLDEGDGGLWVIQKRPRVEFATFDLDGAVPCVLGEPVKEKPSLVERLARAADDLADIAGVDLPDPNCNCHVAPPCSDCVEYGGLRSAVADVRDALKALAEEASAQPVDSEPSPG